MIKRLIIIFHIVILGCENADNFPDTNVNISIPITMPLYSNVFNGVWNYDYINGGIGGIIIVQALDNQFIAYDRSCTFEADSECIISGESTNNPILSCTSCCESKFIIIDGSVTEGPANQALKRYNTYFDGTILYITN